MRHAAKFIAATTLALCPALVQAAAAEFLFALNRVEIERAGARYPAQRGAGVEAGDIVHTGPVGYAQLRFNDGALMALKPNASLQIEAYKAPAPVAPTLAANAASRTSAPSATPGRSILRLLRGAFRTITGAIGHGAGDEYQVITQTATIGIRGTDYSAALEASGFLFVGVSNGQVVVSNAAGELVLYSNQYGVVRGPGSAPQRTLRPPPSLENPITGEGGDGGGDGGDGTGNFGDGGGLGGPGAREGNPPGGGSAATSGKDKPESVHELRPGRPSVFALATGPFQSRSSFAGAGLDGVYLDSNNNPNGFLAGDTQRITIYGTGTAQNRNLGGDSNGLRWGRWGGGSATVGNQPLDLTSQSLHWIYASTGSRPALPTSGTASFDLIGNTDPTDNQGNTGFLGSATLSANFTNQTVASSINLGINNQVWQASGSGSLVSGAPVFAGTYSVNVNNAAGTNLGTGTGDFAGFFTNNAAAAGLSYSLSSSAPGTPTTVSGVAAFARSQGP